MKSSLQQYYSAVREKNRQLAERRQTECETKNPRLRALREERGQVVLSLAAGKLTSEQAQSRIAAISAERKTILIGMGHPATYLDAIYTCPKCKDTGEVGDVLKKPCACQLVRLQKELAEGARINERETFETFDPDVYPESEQKKRALTYKQYFEAYAAALPKPQKPNILMIGDAGTGKTFFGNAIAYAAIGRGIAARKVTAYRLTQDALDGIDGNSAAIRTDTECPLLVIDDLGTEPMIPNVTRETIYRVVNERITEGLPTVVITNLGSEALSERYGERITSRLVDRDVTAIAVFRGANLRTSKR